MEQYLNHIRKIRQYFLERQTNPEWDRLVAEANLCVAEGANYQFRNDCHPHFYSGKLFDFNTLKYIGQGKYYFITLNPTYGEHVNGETNLRSQHSFNDDIQFQNTVFERGADFEMFRNCDHLLNLIKETNEPYPNALNNHGVVIDWIPPYSTNFKLVRIDQALIDFLNAFIVPLCNEACCVIAGGGSFKIFFERENLAANFGMVDITNQILQQYPQAININLRIYQTRRCKLFLFPRLTGRRTNGAITAFQIVAHIISEQCE